MTGDITGLVEAATVLLDAHEAARRKQPHERTDLESDLADLGRNRLRRIISRACALAGEAT